MRTMRRTLLAVMAVLMAAAGSVADAGAVEGEELARPLPQVHAIQLQLINGRPAISVVADDGVLDAEGMADLEALAALDLAGMLEQVRADTLAEIGIVGLPEDVESMIAELTGIDLGEGATNVDALDALMGIAGDVGSSSPNSIAGVAAGGWVVVGLVVILLIGAGYILSDGVGRIPKGAGDDGGETDAGTAPDAGSTSVDTDTSDSSAEEEPTPESLRERAQEQEDAADAADQLADQAEADGDDELAKDYRDSAAALREEAAKKRRKADELEVERLQQQRSGDPDIDAPDPLAVRAYLLALNPGLEGTEFDRIGQALDYMEAYANGDRPVHSNPVPIGDGKGGDVEVDVVTLGCLGPACDLIDPTEDTRKVSVTPSMIEQVMAYQGEPVSPIVSYPPLDDEDPLDGELDEPDGPGPGCEVC